MANGFSGLTSKPIRAGIVYVIIAGSWIVVSNYLIAVFFGDARTIMWIAELSALFLVVASALVFFWTVNRHSSLISDSSSSLHKINRAFMTLSGCHQALLGANDETRLMKEICRIIVEIGGYRLAWVGLAEHNEGKTIRPAAQWGYEDGYLEELNLTWADSERGNGPTGRAIRTGVPIVVQNILKDPESAFWSQEALRRNFSSTVSLPLTNGDERIGALGIYAEESDAFDTAELDLLRELADNLSYGIATLRLRAGREQEEKGHVLLATACEQLEESIAIFDNQGVVQYVNSSLERISGCDRRAVTGKNIRELQNDPNSGQLFGLMANAAARNASWSGRFVTGGGNGSTVEIDAGVSPLRNNGGSITNYVFVGRDASQEQRLEKQLRQAQKMEALGTLAGGIAHDFNNILGAIISCTEFALEDAPRGSPTREDLEHVLKAGYRGKNLIKQILTFSRRGEQGRQPIEVEPLVKESLKFLRASLPSSIEIQQNISPGCGMILADATQVHQVIMNLCTNAAHAMREKGGILEVSLSEVAVDPLRASYSSRDYGINPYVKLRVSDTGHGMDRKVLERIFDPFFTTKKRGEGTGLGLSVVHGIIMNHGGDITVSSEPGKGTTFEVFLPSIERPGEMPEKTKGAAISRGTERILFVDDEEDLVYAGEKMLKRLGYEPVVFQSSAEALKAFSAEPDRFDLIITDQSMPHMTGTELAREALRIRPGTPIILCSGFSPDSGEGLSSREAEQIGIREVVMKPLGSAEMASIIRKILDLEHS
jgi:PAS domain S-box-containing protein